MTTPVGLYVIGEDVDIVAETVEGGMVRVAVKVKDADPSREILLNLQVKLDDASFGHVCNFMKAVGETLQMRRGEISQSPGDLPS